jgi:RNA polymerase sporulation-specific sigma factor
MLKSRTKQKQKQKISKAKKVTVDLAEAKVIVAFSVVSKDYKKPLAETAEHEEVEDECPSKNSKTIFDVDKVEDPLIGTPKEVQEELDSLALYLQKHPEDDEGFAKIQQYINKYLLGLVFKKYSFVRGSDPNDMYQEALIALMKKAIPKFKADKGMSFLNFAKMCINRHLITILHASKHRRKDMPINLAISLDHNPSDQDDDGSCMLSNIIEDDKILPPDKTMANNEAYSKTLKTMMNRLSIFEAIVLEEYLQEKSYKETARNVTKRTGIRYNEKSVDNALLRIRKKAIEMVKECDIDDIPLVMK